MTTCDITSGLLDLLSAPDGSKTFYSQMVPQTIDGSPAAFGGGSTAGSPISLVTEPLYDAAASAPSVLKSVYSNFRNMFTDDEEENGDPFFVKF